MNSSDHDNSESLRAMTASNSKTTHAIHAAPESSDTTKRLTQPLSYGAGIAVQSISQSVAIAVQDASDFMRDVATIETTAIGVATKKMIETENPLYIPLIEACQETMNKAATYWTTVGKDGAEILQAYQKVVSDN